MAPLGVSARADRCGPGRPNGGSGAASRWAIGPTGQEAGGGGTGHGRGRLARGLGRDRQRLRGHGGQARAAVATLAAVCRGGRAGQGMGGVWGSALVGVWGTVRTLRMGLCMPVRAWPRGATDGGGMVRAPGLAHGRMALQGDGHAQTPGEHQAPQGPPRQQEAHTRQQSHGPSLARPRTACTPRGAGLELPQPGALSRPQPSRKLDTVRPPKKSV